MKKTASVMIILLCAVFGVLRYLDIIHLTDSNGFATVYNALVRYALLLVPIAAVLVYSRVYLQQVVKASGSMTLYSTMVLAGIVHIFTGVVSVINAFGIYQSSFEPILAILLSGVGLWLLASGVFSVLNNRPVVGDIFFPILANIYYYVLLIYRFIVEPSSIERMSQTFNVLIPLTVVLFFSAFIRQLFFNVKSDRHFVFTGLLCFLFAGCLMPAEILADIAKSGTADSVTLLQNLSIVSMGWFGLAAALTINRAPKVNFYSTY